MRARRHDGGGGGGGEERVPGTFFGGDDEEGALPSAVRVAEARPDDVWLRAKSRAAVAFAHPLTINRRTCTYQIV